MELNSVKEFWSRRTDLVIYKKGGKKDKYLSGGYGTERQEPRDINRKKEKSKIMRQIHGKYKKEYTSGEESLVRFWHV